MLVLVKAWHTDCGKRINQREQYVCTLTEAKQVAQGYRKGGYEAGVYVTSDSFHYTRVE